MEWKSEGAGRLGRFTSVKIGGILGFSIATKKKRYILGVTSEAAEAFNGLCGCLTAFTEDAMRSPHVDDFVRLTLDIPELALSRGEIGVVRSTWFAPSVAYEVEFHQIGHDYQTRALLRPEQLEVEDGEIFPQSRFPEPHIAAISEASAADTATVSKS
jgi:hypothetical protein